MLESIKEPLLTTEGTFWCENFLLADHFIIPLSLLLFNLLNLQVRRIFYHKFFNSINVSFFKIHIAEYWKAEDAARKMGAEAPKSSKFMLIFYRAGAVFLSGTACFAPSVKS